jgi:3',5'-nucleoside bisphosphate phosphatase
VRYNLADLHIHTSCSDGLCTPAQAVEEAREAGLQAISITDHDTVEGLQEGLEWGRRLGVEVIPGTELSAHVREREVHLLGYCFDPQHGELSGTLSEVHIRRYERGKAIVKRLNGMGVAVTLDEVLVHAKGSPLGRPHIAAAMIDHGIVATKDEAFRRYIGDRAPAFSPKPYTAPQQVIDLIHRAGGVAVLAHPGLSFPEHILTQLVACGLDGIEVFHPAHQPPQIEYYTQLATRHGLLMTGGSDSHSEADGARIGEYGIGYEAIESMRSRAAVSHGSSASPSRAVGSR